MFSDLGEVLLKYYRRKIIAKRESKIHIMKCDTLRKQFQEIKERTEKNHDENRNLIRILKNSRDDNNLLKNLDDSLDNEIENLRQNINELQNQIENIEPIRKGKTRDIWDACDKGCLAAVKFYFAESSKDIINKGDEKFNNWTPLHYAARKGRLNIAKFLYSKGALIDAVTTTNTTPLIVASSQSQINIVSFLLDLGANIDHQNSNNRTALHLAVLSHSLDIAKLLEQYGANSLILDVSGRAPFDYNTWVDYCYNQNRFRNRWKKAPANFHQFLDTSIVPCLETHLYI